MTQFGHRDSPGASPDLAGMELLATALAGRIPTVTELADTVRRDPEELRPVLARLAARGMLTLDGEELSYPDPEAALAAHVQNLLGDAAATLTTQLDEATDLLAHLPQLAASWTLGASEHHDVRAELFHGPYATTDLWFSQATRSPLRRVDGVIADARPLFVADSPLDRLWTKTVLEGGVAVRAILSVDDAALPEARQFLDATTAAGVDVRVMQDPPGWFWVGGDAAGLPLQWGEPWPTSAIAVHSEAVVSLVRWLYDRLWSQAVPLGGTERPWDDLLALMAQGATLKAASHAVGISPRTGRRRIESAMDHYGASGHVALGAAWERERGLNR